MIKLWFSSWICKLLLHIIYIDISVWLKSSNMLYSNRSNSLILLNSIIYIYIYIYISMLPFYYYNKQFAYFQDHNRNNSFHFLVISWYFNVSMYFSAIISIYISVQNKSNHMISDVWKAKFSLFSQLPWQPARYGFGTPEWGHAIGYHSRWSGSSKVFSRTWSGGKNTSEDST